MEKSEAGTESRKLNPYTQAIRNCILQFAEGEGEPEIDEATCQFLANMIQGRFIQYLVSRLCLHYEITEKELENRLIMALMTILSDKFFAVFREKVGQNRGIVYKIAKRIVSGEVANETNTQRMDALFRWISKKYFEYRNFNIILKWIDTNSEVEKVVFLSDIQRKIADPNLVKALQYIVENDRDGIVPEIFNRYLEKDRIDRLHDLIKTGDWRIEAEYVQERSAKMISWRHYIDGMQPRV